MASTTMRANRGAPTAEMRSARARLFTGRVVERHGASGASRDLGSLYRRRYATLGCARALPFRKNVGRPKAPLVDDERLWKSQGLVLKPTPERHIGHAAVAGAHLRRVQIGDGGLLGDSR